MKKIIGIVLSSIFIMGLLGGCAAKMGKKIDDAANSAAGVVEDAGKVVVPDKNSDTGAMSTTETKREKTPQEKEVENFIGEEKAKEIALKQAGLAEKDVIFDKCVVERDDGVWIYEIEFRHGKHEYDVDINANTGRILSWDIDKD